MLITEIVSASKEQASGIAQVNKAVMQMERVMPQDAALMDEAAAASESMNEQARECAPRASADREKVAQAAGRDWNAF